MSRQSGPRGQILFIATFALIVILAIAAIVIDLGFGWMARRAQQNAVDAASVAAARYLEPFDAAEQYAAACFFVQKHGFFTTDDASCSAARATGDLYVGRPTSGPYRGAGFVEVRIREERSTFFGGFVGQPEMTVATGAVAANGGSNVNANALVALDPTSCGAGMLTGNGVINITPVSGSQGGYVYINSICGIDPVYGTDNEACANHGGSQADPRGAMHISGNNAILNTPHLYVRGTCNKTSNPFSGPTTEGAGEISDTIVGLLEPAHGDLVERGGRTSCPAPGQLLNPGPGCVFQGNSGYPVRLEPGVYYGGWVIRGQARIELNPGIYYMAGGGVQMSGGSTALDAVDGSGGIGRVLMFSTGDPTYGGSCVQDANYPPPPPVPAVQYANPIATSGSDGTWAGSHADIDEHTAVDTDFLASPSTPVSTNFYEVDLSGVDTPASLSGVVVRYRYQKSADAGESIDLSVELREGTTVIASETHPDIPGGAGPGWQDGSISLTSAQAASITDWYALSLRVQATASGSGDPRAGRVSWVRVDVPPGAGGSPARRCQGKIELVGGGSFTAKATDITPWKGMLVWQDGTATGNGKGNNTTAKVDLGGQGSMNISGTVYAPKAECFLRGNSASDPADRTAAVQLICWQFEIVGNGGLNIPYDANELFGNHRKGLVH